MTMTTRAITPTIACVFAVAGLACAVPAMADEHSSFEIKPKARLHVDYGHYDADVEPLADGVIVRRAVVGLEGKFGSDWEFEVGYDLDHDGNFRPGEGGFRDLTLTYEGWDAGDITVGQFKLPFGLAEATSSNDITFIERALPIDAFTLSRRVGVGFSHERDGYTLRAMAFGSSLDGGDRGRGLAARFTVAPVHTARTVVHFGVGAVTEDPRSNEADFDTTPEARVADEDLVNTGDIEHVERINRVGLEAAWRSGPVSVQGEWMRARVQREAGWSSADFGGWYVGASWVLTGEMRPYKDGEFKGIEPDSPWGAWEVTARYSRINLDDAALRGGKEHNVTLGLNYYLNEHVRIMFNYIKVHSERHGVADNPDIVLLRAQFVL